jgi:hypothetical protein
MSKNGPKTIDYKWWKFGGKNRQKSMQNDPLKFAPKSGQKLNFRGGVPGAKNDQNRRGGPGGSIL